MTHADRRYMYGLDLLRVLASVLVVYTHAANWFAEQAREWTLSTAVEKYVVAPLGLNPRLSFVGVAAFFVISGLVITHVADRETGPQFLRRRMARIVPLLVAATFLAWCLGKLGHFVPASGQQELDVTDLALAASLLGFFTTPEVVLLGLAWTLLVQIAFYTYIALTGPLLRGYPWMPFALAAAVSTAALPLATYFGERAVLWVSVTAAYFPVLCIGALVGLVHTRKMRPVVGMALGSVHFLLFVWANRLSDHLHSGAEHPKTVALVVGVVVLALTAHDRLSRSAPVRNWARRTYAIYLLHPLCLYPVLNELVPVLGASASLLVALLVLAAAVEIVHRWFEMPVDRWMRSRERSRAPERGAAEAGLG